MLLQLQPTTAGSSSTVRKGSIVICNKIDGNEQCGSVFELFLTVVLTLSVTAFFYYCYFLLAPWIWSQNVHYLPQFITPWMQEASATEYDGVEIYALYLLVFLNSLAALVISLLIGRSCTVNVRIILMCAGALCAGVFCAAVGFTPPMSTFTKLSSATILRNSLPLILIVSFLLAVLLFLQRKAPRWILLVTTLLLIPVCFIATYPYSWYDYSFIFSPALRLINGVALSDIYFQYDLLPSLLAAAWMKLGLDLDGYQVLGQAAYFFALLGVFIYSGRLFQKKELSIFFLGAVVVARIYASPWDAVYCFQVTPLRLDLWIPLFGVVLWRGPYHWLAGLVCGALLILLKNMGIIYTLAYLQLLMTLYVIRYLDGDRKQPLFRDMIAYGRQCVPPLAIIAVAFVIAQLMFHNAEYPNFSGHYQKIGIGFIKISEQSFYWYIPALISSVLILLFRMRARLSSAYLTCGLLLTFCAIGNSIYFFGRSHEHNIINISIVLLFLCFFWLDLVATFLKEEHVTTSVASFLRRQGVVCVAFMIVVAIIVYYSDNFHRKTVRQRSNLAKGRSIYSIPLYDTFVPHRNILDFISGIKSATNNSSKVYFVNVDGADFWLYYYGGYVPVGYCSPFRTWIFSKDLGAYLQKLLDDGYYLVYDNELMYLNTALRYNHVNFVGSNVIVARLPAQTPGAHR